MALWKVRNMLCKECVKHSSHRYIYIYIYIGAIHIETTWIEIGTSYTHHIRFYLK